MNTQTITDTIAILEFASFYDYIISSGMDLLEVIEEAEGSEFNFEHVSKHVSGITQVLKDKGLEGALEHYRGMEVQA